MLRILATSLIALLSAASADAKVVPFPSTCQVRDIATNATSLHVRICGTGPAVVLLHGYGETGDMWAPLATNLARDHTVVVPDLRGMGLSARTAGGYDKKTQGYDIAGLLDALKIAKVDLITHDIGNMVGFAFAAEHRDRVKAFVLMDAPLPGVGPWDEVLKSPLLWHFRFGGPDMERLVAGRERIYLDRFWNDFSADPKKFDEESRQHYAALYARPGAMHAGFEQFKAFDQDVKDDQAFVAAGRLTMPVLAIGGDHSFGPEMLLQSVQSLTLRFQLAADDLPEGAPARASLITAIDTADKVIAEGRDRVRELRSQHDGNLEQIICECITRLGFDSSLPVSISSDGVPRSLDEAVLDEITRIASEALFNIHRHASATEVTVKIQYGANLQIRFDDDGNGIDAEIAAAGGKAGHYGLLGMIERARRLRGDLVVQRRPDRGTEVLLTIPGAIAYKPRTFRHWSL